MSTKWFFYLACFVAILPLASSTCGEARANDSSQATRPNILWITSDDNGPQFGCYGDAYATTPNLDALAAKGVKFTRCWSNAPVCAPARTTIISGMYATSIGSSNMRSRAHRPPNTKILPELMRSAGYYCTNNNKEDYNFYKIGEPWDNSSNRGHWRNRPANTPFFSVFNLGITHESQVRKRPHTPVHDAAKVTVPPYHPDLPEVRQDWAQYYDKIQEMDTQVGRILKELERDGLADSTVVFYLGDHGSGMPRGKRWLYQSGLHVPLIVHVPEGLRHLVGEDYQPGGDSGRLVSFVDLMPTVLNLAGVDLPSYLQGRPFLGKNLPPASPVNFGFRDRMDERIDMSRAVRNERYLYIKNFLPYREQGMYQSYMLETPTTQVWLKAFQEGKLNEVQAFFWKHKPSEELYDIDSDPYQVKNRIDDPALASVREELRGQLRSIMIETRDHGVIPESIIRAREISPDWKWDEMVDAAFNGSSLDRPAPDYRSENPVVRFWAARRILYEQFQPQAKHAQSEPAFAKLLEDPSPSVQIVAAEAAARQEDAEGRKRGIAKLLEYSDLRKAGGICAVLALNALVSLDSSDLDMEKIKEIPTEDPDLEPVYGAYIPRLLAFLLPRESN